MSLLLLFGGGGTPGVYTLNAEVGSFTLTGQAATLRPARSLSAAASSYTLTGQIASLFRQYFANAANGAFVVSGQPATLFRTRLPLDAVATSYTLSGQDAFFDRTFAALEINAESASYTLVGNDIGVLRNRVLAGEVGVYVDGEYVSTDYVLSGYIGTTGATLAVNRVGEVTSASLTLTGASATLSKWSPYPDPSVVLEGVSYGPGGIYVGTLDTLDKSIKLDITTGNLVKPISNKVVMTL